jgi:hypothetical protein
MGIENALAERVNRGTKKEPDHQPRYTIEQLLDPEFRLPAPPTKEEKERNSIAFLKSLKGVKTFQVN